MYNLWIVVYTAPDRLSWFFHVWKTKRAMGILFKINYTVKDLMKLF